MIYGVTKDEKKKPAIIKLYDFTKGGTDVVDMRMQTFSVKPKSKRWPIASFSYILDTARVNSQTVNALNNGTDPRASVSFERINELGEALIIDLVRRRYVSENTRYLDSDIRDEMAKMIGVQHPLVTTTTGNVKTCHVCKTYRIDASRPKRSKLVCSDCHKPTCSKHIPYYRCNICFSSAVGGVTLESENIPCCSHN